MTLPLLLSVPHAGLRIPEHLSERCLLPADEVARDGDVGASVIYDLADEVRFLVTTDVARAVLDMNRAEDDFRKDGVVKTHTCWDVPIWREPLGSDDIERLLAEHHRPYHRALDERVGQAPLAIDCHTMAAVGPPVGPDPGVERPMACLGDGGGQCPPALVEGLQRALARHLPGRITVNDPFGGGFITRSHGSDMPWIQLELSRTPAVSDARKRAAVLAALTDLCDEQDWSGR